jgi:hypothetical protein
MGDVPIAICFFGLVKLHRDVQASIKRQIFDVLKRNGLDYHVYLHTYALSEVTNARNKEHKTRLDANAWKGLAPHFWRVTDQGTFDSTVRLQDYLRNGDAWPENRGVSLMNHLRALHSQKLVTGLWTKSRHAYRCVIYLRPDMVYIDPLDMQAVKGALRVPPGKSVVYTPSWQSAPGYNDRMAVGSVAAMRAYGMRSDGALAYAQGNRVHSETYLKYSMDRGGAARLPLRMRAVRMRGTGVIDARDEWEFGGRGPGGRGPGGRANGVRRARKRSAGILDYWKH